eukprot:gene15217-biopygen3555
MGGWSDTHGNFYIADQTRIRKVDAFGIMNTICGTGVSDFNADGAPANATLVSHVKSVWGDSLGNLFYIDRNNQRLRKIDVNTSIVTTVVGGGVYRFNVENETGTSNRLSGSFMTGDSVGNLYYSDTSNYRVRKFVKSTGKVLTIAGKGINAYDREVVVATSSSIRYPTDLVVDTSGNVFFIEFQRIRRVTPEGIMQTIIGTGDESKKVDGAPGTSTSLFKPQSLYIDSLGNLFWVDVGYYTLRKYTQSTGLVSTLLGIGGQYAGDGLNITSNTSQIFISARGVWGNSRGDIFIADTNNNRVRSIVNQIINTVAGNGYLSYGDDGGPATSAYINSPNSVWGNTLGTVYFADGNNFRIRAISAAGIITTLGGTGKDDPFTADVTAFTSMSLSDIQALSGDSNGNLYFMANGRLTKYVISSSSVQILAGTGLFLGNGKTEYNQDNASASGVFFYNPREMWVNTKGDVYLTESGLHLVRVYNQAAERVWNFAGNGIQYYSEDRVPATQTGVNPYGVWGDTLGNVFINDYYNGLIRRVLSDGIITTFAGSPFGGSDGDGVSATSVDIFYTTSVTGDSLVPTSSSQPSAPSIIPTDIIRGEEL